MAVNFFLTVTLVRAGYFKAAPVVDCEHGYEKSTILVTNLR